MLPAIQDISSLLSWDALANHAPTETRIAMGLMGVLLLIWGSRSKRLVSAAPGVLLGITAASLVLSDQSQTTQWVGSLGAGLAGGVAAMLVQSIALRTAGALVGGIGVTVLYPVVSDPGLPPWWLPLAGALVGAILLPRLFNAAMKIMSPILGAMCLTFALQLAQNHQIYGIIGFSVLGLALPFLLSKRAVKEDA